MPQFDLRYIKAAKYENTNGTISYSEATLLGDAMEASLQLKYAEGRVYAEGGLAEYLKMATGGTISVAVKYIPDAAQKLLFGARTSSRTVAGSQTAITGLKYGQMDKPGYVGVAFYAPDMIDGVQKYTCVFITRALFGMPGFSFKTLGENISFQTPTTTGEFLADHSQNQEMLEIGIADSEALARAWVDAVLGAAGGASV